MPTQGTSDMLVGYMESEDVGVGDEIVKGQGVRSEGDGAEG